MTITNIMVDLETLGRRPGCRILSLGAVVFTADGLGREFYQEAKINDQGTLSIDNETLEWWGTQLEEVRARLFDHQDTKPTLTELLTNFNAWLVEVSSDGSAIWGNGADFDNAILQVAYDQLGLRLGWSFWNNRCYRTLKSLVPAIKLMRQGEHHNALDDAKSQAAHAVKLMNFLQAW